MKKTNLKAAILSDITAPKEYVITFTLLGGIHGEIKLDDRRTAREMFNDLRNAGVISGEAIRLIEYNEIPVNDKTVS